MRLLQRSSARGRGHVAAPFKLSFYLLFSIQVLGVACCGLDCKSARLDENEYSRNFHTFSTTTTDQNVRHIETMGTANSV